MTKISSFILFILLFITSVLAYNASQYLEYVVIIYFICFVYITNLMTKEIRSLRHVRSEVLSTLDYNNISYMNNQLIYATSIVIEENYEQDSTFSRCLVPYALLFISIFLFSIYLGSAMFLMFFIVYYKLALRRQVSTEIVDELEVNRWNSSQLIQQMKDQG